MELRIIGLPYEIAEFVKELQGQIDEESKRLEDLGKGEVIITDQKVVI